MNVGLTGGIACGKSTVARMLAEKGAVLIDFDEMAHAVEDSGGPVWREIVRHFGEEILHEDRTIDRRKLGETVFADREKRELLNRLVHPAIFEEWQRRLEEIRARHADAIIVSDIPLLVEAGLKEMVDLVLLVYITPEEQIRRVMARDGFSREEAERRLAAQMPIEEKLRWADIIIHNEGSPEETRRTVCTVWMELQNREQRRREGIGRS
ncbi:MAG: dephospho-CoA kinase [Proteobacteria bacterium]|nr:dephospho-CoA kinase [Pseudomonadota bacterium]